jgi:pimeloyl-ACP methyl ester carboxylesterase
MKLLLCIALISFFALTTSCGRTAIKETLTYDNARNASGGQFVRLSDGWTHYELCGPESGCIVVLIHGGTIPLCIWDPQIAALHHTGFRTLRYDQYGKGYSERVGTEYDRALFTRQLTELLDSLNINGQVDIIGPSFGGAIAVSFAALHPERVRSICFISPVFDLIGSDSPLAGPIKLMRIPVLGTLMWSAVIRAKLINRGLSMTPKGSGCDSTFLKQYAIKGTKKGLLSMFRSDAYKSYYDAAKKVGASTIRLLLLRGDSDKEVTPAMIDKVRSSLPTCRYIELKKAGHSPGSNADAADRLNSIIVDFLQGREIR